MVFDIFSMKNFTILIFNGNFHYSSHLIVHLLLEKQYIPIVTL